MKTKNTRLLPLLIGVIMLTQCSARAEFGIGDVWGTAWTIGNVIIGETTLTPAYAVNTWTSSFQGTSRYGVLVGNLSILKKVKRDLLGNYFYYTRVQSSSSPTVETHDPFPVLSMNQINKTCTYDIWGDGTVTATETIVETHSELVWMAKVEQTGLWPDDGPWTVWLKTAGAKIRVCPSSIPPYNTFFWVSANIGKSGSQTVFLGHPNCRLDYPFYLASDFYK